MKHPIKYLWDKLDSIDGQSGLFIFLIVLAMGVFLGGIFWFNGENIPKDSPLCESSFLGSGDSCTILHFDNHGIGAVGWLVITLILLEIFFFIYLFVNKKPAWRSWVGYTLVLKLKALGDVLLVYIVVLPIFSFIPKLINKIIENWSEVQETFIKIFVTLGIILLIILFFFLNVLFSRIFSKEQQRKFKVGDKVRVRSDLIYGKSYCGKFFNLHMKDFMGKIVTLTYFDKEKIYIKEDKGECSWREEMFEELKGGKKNVKSK